MKATLTIFQYQYGVSFFILCKKMIIFWKSHILSILIFLHHFTFIRTIKNDLYALYNAYDLVYMNFYALLASLKRECYNPVTVKFCS